MSDLLKISLALSAVLAVFCVFEFVLPRQFENSLKDTQLLDETALVQSANTGRLCRCEMVADSKSISKLQQVTFAKSLHCSQSVTVIDLLEKNGKNLRFKSFPIHGNGSDEKHPVIVTKLCSKDLTRYFQDNYLVGGALVKMVNDDSHYQNEPSVVGSSAE